MDLSDLLKKKEIDSSGVLVLRHRPPKAGLYNRLLRLAAEDADAFNAFQQTQSEVVEKAMKKASYVASFIGHEPGKAAFVGLYRVDGSKRVSRRQLLGTREYKHLLGLDLLSVSLERQSMLRFDLSPIDKFYGEWKGKLVIKWPPPELSWFRWADRNSFPIEAVLHDSIFVDKVPKWDEVSMTWTELHELPTQTKAALGTWRGIYYICDVKDSRGYVGAAYGKDNLLGRWQSYAKSGHGGNKHLRGRDPKKFAFSILQLLTHDASQEDVIKFENSWKLRLQTRHPRGLNDN